MKISPIEKIISLAKEGSIIRPRDLDAYGIPREYLRRLCVKGILDRQSRGIYTLRDAELTQHHSLMQACKRLPKGVVCLLSALRFHGLTTQAPFEIWMAIDRKAGYQRQKECRFISSVFPVWPSLRESSATKSKVWR